MSQSAKNILISIFLGLILFLILAIGYNLKIIPISINVSNTIQSIQKQVDQIGIEFLGQLQIERAKMKDLTENSFIVDSFENQIITDKVYSEVYEYTIRNKNCYGITFVNNEKTIFFVYPPYASKRKGMVIASDYFNNFLTKEYSILPFQTSKEIQETDEVVLGYPVQKNGKVLGLALFHYSGTSLLAEPIKKSPLSIKKFVFVRQYNMIIYNVEKELLEQKTRFSDVLTSIEESNKTLGPVKIGETKYYFFSSQVGKSGKHVVVLPYNKVGTPLIVQVVISFYLLTIIILIIYVLLAFFFSPKEEQIDVQGNKYYKKPEQYEELKNEQEEEEFLSAVSSDEKKKDFFFEEVNTEKTLDKSFKSLVEDVTQKKSPLEVTLEEEYLFNPPEVPVTESTELPEFSTEKTQEELSLSETGFEENIEQIQEGKEFELKGSELPSLEELEASKEEYKQEESFEKPTENQEFELPEEVVSIKEEIKELESMELPEIGEEKLEEQIEQPVQVEEEVEENQSNQIPQVAEKVEEKLEEVESIHETMPEINPEEISLPDLEDQTILEESKENEDLNFNKLKSSEEELPTLEELVAEENNEIPSVEISEEIPPLEDFSSLTEEKPKTTAETFAEEESSFTELPKIEELEANEEFNIEKPYEESISAEITGKETVEELEEIEQAEQKTEEFEIPPIEELEEKLPDEQIEKNLQEMPSSLDEFSDIEPIGSLSEELEIEDKQQGEQIQEIQNEEKMEEKSEEISNEMVEDLKEEESEFFGDISSDEIALSTEELENVTKEVEKQELEETYQQTGLENETIAGKENDMENAAIEDIVPESLNTNEESQDLNVENLEDLNFPEISEDEFKDLNTEVAIEKKLPFDDICSSFALKYNIDAIAFYKAEPDFFTCSGTSDSNFYEIQFDKDEPIIEKLATLRKDIYIPEGINRFEPLLQKNSELFSEMNSMYVHGIFDEGQLLGVIFIFSRQGNEKEKEEYYHISSKLAESLV